MARAIWSGVISFGLVSIPVAKKAAAKKAPAKKAAAWKAPAKKAAAWKAS